LASLGLSITAGRSQSFQLNWFSIDGGGGRSSGGPFTVTGTIGQPDTSRLSGGNFTLTGGLWSFLSLVQIPGSPRLSTALSTTNTAIVSWPSPSTGFTLQQNTNSLSSVNWSNVTSIQDNGTLKYSIINPPTGNCFFRLMAVP
jgi:hypothetical protein